MLPENEKKKKKDSLNSPGWNVTYSILKIIQIYN